MSIPNLIALAAFFSPRRIAKFLGFCGGVRRYRQEPHVSLIHIMCATTAAAVIAVLTFLHVTAVEETTPVAAGPDALELAA
jgi:hypothetical protein